MRTRRIVSLVRRFAVPLTSVCLLAAVLAGAVILLAPDDGSSGVATLPAVELLTAQVDTAGGPAGTDTSPVPEGADAALNPPASQDSPTGSAAGTTVRTSGSPATESSPSSNPGSRPTASPSVTTSTPASAGGGERQVVEEPVRIERSLGAGDGSGPLYQGDGETGTAAGNAGGTGTTAGNGSGAGSGNGPGGTTDTGQGR